MQTSQVKMKFREFQTSGTMASAKLHPTFNFHSLSFSSCYTAPSPRKGTFATNKDQLARFLSFGNGGCGYDVIVATTIALRCSPPNVVHKINQQQQTYVLKSQFTKSDLKTNNLNYISNTKYFKPSSQLN
jgi:hypothetical protein